MPHDDERRDHRGGYGDDDVRMLLRRIILGNRVIITTLFRLGSGIANMERQMALDLAALEAAVAKNTEVDESASVLLDALTAEIKRLADQSTNPAEQARLNELAASLAARNDALSAAVLKNTPSAPEPT